MAARRKAKDRITLSEFKTWLAGVQSMQPEGWHPNKDNWAMILQQIDNIKETVVEKEIIKEVQVEVDRSIAAAAQQFNNPPMDMDPRNPAWQADRAAPVEIPSTLMEMPPVVEPAPPVGTPVGDNGAVSVDIIDSDGGYESSFS